MDLDKALEYARAIGLTDRQIAVAVQAAADEKRFTQLSDDVVIMTHPLLDGREEPVHKSAVEVHEKSGWVVKPPNDDVPDEVAASYAAIPAQVSTEAAAGQSDQEDDE